MTGSVFELHPHASVDVSDMLETIRLTGTVKRSEHHLMVQYCLAGPVAALIVPQRAPMPLRQNNLWQATCFELFMAFSQWPTYWEVNVSPSGHWNVYRFTAYRQGMQPEADVKTLTSTLRQTETMLTLDIRLDLDAMRAHRPASSAPDCIDLGISAVLQSQQGDLSYWALTHPAAQADFHHRDCFVMHV